MFWRCLLSIGYFLTATTLFTVSYADPPNTWQGMTKFIPEGSNGDRFGKAVSLHGGTALVGAPQNCFSCNGSGAAFLFSTADGMLLHELTHSEAEPQDAFGFSTALDGTVALVGAPSEDDSLGNADRGAAYLFDVSTGNQITRLSHSDNFTSGDQFGYSVAIDGDTAVVGAPFDDPDDSDGDAGSGAAYVFQDNGMGTWSFVDKLTVADPAPLKNVGLAVAIKESRIIVGAPFDFNNLNSSGLGSAYVFEDDGTGNWSQTEKFVSTDLAANDKFGASVALEGSTALVGAPYFPGSLNDIPGAAYVFEVTTGIQTEKLTANDGTDGDLFGWSVALDGSTAVVSAPDDDDNLLDSGSAYFFDATTGDQVDKVIAIDGAQSDSFGEAVAIDGAKALVGAHFDFTGGGVRTGSAYLFRQFLAADFEQDGDVDQADLARWESSFGDTVDVDHMDGDSDRDGDVDGVDFLTWQRQLGLPSPHVALESVPEPRGATIVSCLILLGMANLRSWQCATDLWSPAGRLDDTRRL